MRTYLAASHAVVSPDGREHSAEQALQQRGLQRRVVVGLSHFMSLLPIIEGSDLIATVPRDLANICVHHGAIRIVDPPFKSPVVEVHQFWHGAFTRTRRTAGSGSWCRRSSGAVAAADPRSAAAPLQGFSRWPRSRRAETLRR